MAEEYHFKGNRTTDVHNVQEATMRINGSIPGYRLIGYYGSMSFRNLHINLPWALVTGLLFFTIPSPLNAQEEGQEKVQYVSAYGIYGSVPPVGSSYGLGIESKLHNYFSYRLEGALTDSVFLPPADAPVTGLGSPMAFSLNVMGNWYPFSQVWWLGLGVQTWFLEGKFAVFPSVATGIALDLGPFFVEAVYGFRLPYAGLNLGVKFR